MLSCADKGVAGFQRESPWSTVWWLWFYTEMLLYFIMLPYHFYWLSMCVLFSLSQALFVCLQKLLYFKLWLQPQKGSPGGSAVKNPPAMQETQKTIPVLGRSPGGRHGNPLQYSCLENPMDRGVCRARVHGVATEARKHSKSKKWGATALNSRIMSGREPFQYKPRQNSLNSNLIRRVLSSTKDAKSR